MKKQLIAGLAATGLALSLVSPASAAVTFDPAPTAGTGFAGKGDVQLALGYNNKQMQLAEKNVVFEYTDQATYDVPCEKETKKETLRKSYKRKSSVSGTVASDPRVKNQITGYHLNGYMEPGLVTEGKVECPDGWTADGEPVLVGASGGQLTASHADRSGVIWTPAS